MNQKQIFSLIFVGILIGFGLGYEFHVLITPKPEPELEIELPQPNIIEDWFVNQSKSVITLCNQEKVVIKGLYFIGTSLTVENSSEVLILAPHIRDTENYAIKIVNCTNVMVLDFYIWDTDIGIIVLDSSHITLGSQECFDEEGNRVFNSHIHLWRTYPLQVLNSDYCNIMGVNATMGGPEYFGS